MVPKPSYQVAQATLGDPAAETRGFEATTTTAHADGTRGREYE